MAIVINGSGTVTGISVGGLPDDIVDAGTLANNAVGLAQMAGGTDGNVITYDTSGNPAVVATGSDGQVLTSAGADAVPAFETAAAGGEDGLTNNSNTTWMTVSADEEVNMPLQPSFNCTVAGDDLAVGSENELALTERYDIGSNLASNTFTAPITGKYLITYMLNFDELHEAHTQFVIGIKTSNYEYSFTQSPKNDLDTTIYTIGFSASQICDMDSSDTMTFVIDITLGGAQTDIVATSTVSGHLLA